jgi:hypothetical protein
MFVVRYVLDEHPFEHKFPTATEATEFADYAENQGAVITAITTE